MATQIRVDADDRAPPAHVERTGGRRIDFVDEVKAIGPASLPGMPAQPRGASVTVPSPRRG